jgi:glutamate synthase domain-containing protein 3
MTPKEKAEELGNSMYNGSVFDYDKQGHLKEIVNARRCALIAVDEIILNETERHGTLSKIIDYWEEVKQEINKL